MGKALLKVLLKFIVTIANIFLAPIDALITNVIPDLSTAINYLNNIIDTYIVAGIDWFIYMFPTPVINAIALFLSIYISFYLVSYTIHGILAIIKVIKNIKIW